MVARTGMTDLITELRLVTETDEGQDTVNGTEYWTDDQLQTELDATRVTLDRLPITPITTIEASDTGPESVYTRYPFPASIGRWVEQHTTSGAVLVQDYRGITVQVGVGASAANPDYIAREVVFNSDTGGDVYYLSIRHYDLYRAAAKIWRIKAGLRRQKVNWKTDNHTIYEDQEYQHCITQAEYFERQAGLKVSKFVRIDERRGRYGKHRP